jgi:DNA ligase-associated metallophosphoesterase
VRLSPELPVAGGHSANALPPCKSRMEILFGGEPVLLDACGALFLPSHGILAVADLHLEKGSFFAARGNPVPRHDTRDTLLRLGAAIDLYRPRMVVCLGDSFHDAGAAERMALPDRRALMRLMARSAAWVWLTGNHDPVIPAMFGSAVAALHVAGAVTLAHMPEAPARPLIAGHYHPKLSVRLTPKQSVSGRCFLYGDELLLMPAFGAYAGGLDTRDEALRPFFAAGRRRHVLAYGGKLWAVNAD